jgi:DNA-binding NarL/FixJ family response regulator
MIKMLLFEDNKTFRTNLTEFLKSTEDIELLGSYGDAREVIPLIKKFHPDLVLMDIQMPFISGLDALALIKKYDPKLKS